MVVLEFAVQTKRSQRGFKGGEGGSSTCSLYLFFLLISLLVYEFYVLGFLFFSISKNDWWDMLIFVSKF